MLAGHASVALENARLYESQRREADHLKALLEFTGAISQAETPDEIGHETVQAASHMLGGKDCALWLPLETGDYRIAAHSDYDSDLALRPMLDVVLPADAVRAIVGERVEPFLLVAGDAKRHAPSVPWPDLALAPLWNDAFIEGFIGVREPIGGEHTLEEVLRLLAGISHQAAVALERARRFESLEDTFVSTVEALANALEANDEYTSSHTRWITDMALKVGEELGFDPPALKRLELGALFHDIGKIGIPRRHPAQARAAHGRRARGDIEIHPDFGSGSSSRSTGSPRCARSCAAATSAGMARATRTERAARTSPSRPGSCSPSAMPSTR